VVSILVLEDEKGGRCECGLTWTSGIRKRNSGTDSLRIEEHFCFTNGLITCLLFVISIGISCILHTVFPRIEAPGLYWYNFVRPPACIRGPACIQDPACISTSTLRRIDGLMSPSPLGVRSGEGAVAPSPEYFSIVELKNASFGTFWVLFLQLN